MSAGGGVALSAVAPLRARLAHAERVRTQRLNEARCAWEFLVYGDTRGPHADVCVRPGGLVCGRDYDPGPPPEDPKMYQNSALGTLWGMNTTEAWQLAGWNVRRRRP
jgi:hypothetical protein